MGSIAGDADVQEFGRKFLEHNKGQISPELKDQMQQTLDKRS
jgi:hypothetical protein